MSRFVVCLRALSSSDRMTELSGTQAVREGPKMKIAATLAALAVVSALALGSSPDASACGMSVRLDPTPQKPTPVQEIAKAEKSLEGSQNLSAAKTILATFPRIRVATAGQNPLETRALRVFALAVVRSNGVVNEKAAGFP